MHLNRVVLLVVAKKNSALDNKDIWRTISPNTFPISVSGGMTAINIRESGVLLTD
jgi:predicted DNA-binding transcriptional regulator AlpA